MSAQTIGGMIAQGGSVAGGRTDARSPLDWARRWTPEQGWFALLLFVVVLLVTGALVTEAAWVETPGLKYTLVLSALAGLALAKARWPAVLLLPLGLAVGAAVIVWQGSLLMDGDGPVDNLQTLWERLTTWYTIASGDGISTDVVPMSLGMLGLGWVVGFLGSWFVFRRSNVWPGVLLNGVAILTTLSFLPLDIKYTSRFFMFTFFAMLLIVRMNSIQQHRTWKNSGTTFEHSNSWLSLYAAFVISLVILIAAAILPARVYISDWLVNTWSAGRAPVEFMEEEFARLFGVVPSRKDLFGRFFGRSMAFKGAISFDGDTVMWASTEFPSYWTTRTYSEYTSQGWKSGATQPLYTTPDTLMPAPGESLNRLDVNQTVIMNFETKSAMAGGDLQWISRSMILETLEPKQFDLDLLSDDADAELPADVREVADLLRRELNPLPENMFVESYVSRRLPSDLVLLDVQRQRGLVGEPDVIEKVTLERKEPVSQEIVSWRFTDRLQQGDSYSMVSSVSVARNNDLRSAGAEYSGFIRDHYLHLPSSLPQRVRELAANVTTAAPTPLDKALIIRDYLRSPQFTYSQDIEAAPPGVDAVDYFLFDTQIGYSDYYASSMAVMLRATGVPARLAGGYAPGRELPSGIKGVIDRDSHVWVQVYFPGYGWIDFEPTPKWPTHARVLPGIGGMADNEDLPLDRLARPDPSALGLEPDLLFPEMLPGDNSLMSKTFNLRNLVVLASVIGGAVLLAAAVRTAWLAGMGKLNTVERIYLKMNRLGTLAGIGRRYGQTPTEYAHVIGGRIPTVAAAATAVSAEYSSSTYGRHGFPTGEEEEEEELNDSWHTIRGGLLKQILKRVVPIRSSRVR